MFNTSKPAWVTRITHSFQCQQFSQLIVLRPTRHKLGHFGNISWHNTEETKSMTTRRPASADRTARRQASDAMTSRLPRYEAKCVQHRCFQWGSVPLRLDIKGTELPPDNILIPFERQLIVLQLCRWEFLYNETLQQSFRPLLSKLYKRRQN